MLKYIESFFEEFDYPIDSKKTLISAYKTIEESNFANRIFTNSSQEYKNNINCDYSSFLESCEKIAKELNIHEYTVKLLLFICLSKELRNHYKINFYSDEMFHRTILDLKYKLIECKLIKGIDGIFVATWMVGFFNLTRFGFKRLQFEVKGVKVDYKSLKAGDPVIVIHIPRTGTPLLPSEYEEDFEAAKIFFKKSFTATPMAFSCHSWLLNEKLREFLSEKSNIISFMNKFEIVYTDFHEVGNYNQIWRLFDVDYNGNLQNLPADTSLRCAFKKYLIEGGKWGAGYGIFFA